MATSSKLTLPRPAHSLALTAPPRRIPPRSAPILLPRRTCTASCTFSSLNWISSRWSASIRDRSSATCAPRRAAPSPRFVNSFPVGVQRAKACTVAASLTQSRVCSRDQAVEPPAACPPYRLRGRPAAPRRARSCGSWCWAPSAAPPPRSPGSGPPGLHTAKHTMLCRNVHCSLFACRPPGLEGRAGGTGRAEERERERSAPSDRSSRSLMVFSIRCSSGGRYAVPAARGGGGGACHARRAHPPARPLTARPPATVGRRFRSALQAVLREATHSPQTSPGR